MFCLVTVTRGQHHASLRSSHGQIEEGTVHTGMWMGMGLLSLGSQCLWYGICLCKGDPVWNIDLINSFFAWFIYLCPYSGCDVDVLFCVICRSWCVDQKIRPNIAHFFMSLSMYFINFIFVLYIFSVVRQCWTKQQTFYFKGTVNKHDMIQMELFIIPLNLLLKCIYYLYFKGV